MTCCADAIRGRCQIAAVIALAVPAKSARRAMPDPVCMVIELADMCGLFLVERNYPEAAALSFLMLALILVMVIVYIRLAGTEALMGEEEEARA